MSISARTRTTGIFTLMASLPSDAEPDVHDGIRQRLRRKATEALARLQADGRPRAVHDFGIVEVRDEPCDPIRADPDAPVIGLRWQAVVGLSRPETAHVGEYVDGQVFSQVDASLVVVPVPASPPAPFAASIAIGQGVFTRRKVARYDGKRRDSLYLWERTD